MPEEESNPTDKAISERIHSIFPDQAIADQVVKLVTSEKPFGWGRKSNATYYNRRCGDKMRANIEKMIETREAMLFPYEVFCEDGSMERQTLYNLVNQSILYVRERMDTPDSRYEQWYQSVTVERSREKKGVYIAFKKGKYPTDKEGVELSPSMVIPDENKPVWEREIDDWVESESFVPYVKQRLVLSDEDVVKLKAQFAGVKNILASIDNCSVRLVRVSGV